MQKVILISIDGMRPDGLRSCKNPYLDEMMQNATYTWDAQTVYPSITLPCHLSMFHSIPPQRHGTLTNTYAVPVRPVCGLFERLKALDKTAAMYYGWEPLREIGRPGSLVASEFIHARSFENVDTKLTDSALRHIRLTKPDFVFLYMVDTDEKGGHDNGWMSGEYLACIHNAISNVKRVIEETNGEYAVIVTADHGGHDRGHGTDMPEDMTIPMFFFGERFAKNREIHDVSILDIAPTVCDIMGILPVGEWEGKSLLNRDGEGK